MKLPLLCWLAALALPTLMHAEEPVYDIAHVSDKDNNHWGMQSFRVWMLAGNQGWESLAGHLEIGRDDKGLIVVVRGMPVSHSPLVDANADKWDSVEIFFGAKKGSGRYYEAIIGAVDDPATNDPVTNELKPHIVIKDFREPEGGPKPGVTAEVYEEKGGYGAVVRLPFNDPAIVPKDGEEASLQVYINATDAAGRRHTVSWHPEYRNHTDPAAMYRIRLAPKSSPDVYLAVRARLDQGSPRVDVYSAENEADGKTVKVMAKGTVVATGILESNNSPSMTSLLVSPNATSIVCEGGGSAPIDFTILPDLITAGVLNMRPIFKPCVFSGEKFPVCDLEKPVDTEQALGKCTLTPTFYDADYNEVKTAAKPGRYGAIVHVETANGQKFNRFVTLYRAPEELLGRTLRPEFTDVKLPPELGIDPAVVSSHLRSVGDLFDSEFRTSAGISRGPEAAILLAWLSELKPDAAPDLQRTGPSTADQKWWYGLKKKTGNLRHDYYVYLPPDYDKDPQKKWPLILFLHGSGERGYDLKLLARQGLPQEIANGKNYPFIIVAPQCSPGEWWSIPELDDLLDGLPAKYRIDPDRVYLTGLSMGGYASWAYAAAEPERFAAIVPICGGGDPREAARFKGMPIWVFHGGKDDAVPIQRSQEMVDALKALGSNVQFTIFPDADHFSWVPAYKMPELYEWLLQQKRK